MQAEDLSNKEALTKHLNENADSVIRLLKEYEQHQGWKKTKETDLVKQYYMKIGDSLACRGISSVNFPLSQVQAFIEDQGIKAALNPGITEGKYIKNDHNVKLVYMKYVMPWPIAWRDFVTVLKVHKQGEEKVYQGIKSCLYPYPKQEEIIRGEIKVGGWILQKISENKTKVTYMTTVDIKGSIPKLMADEYAKYLGHLAGIVQRVMHERIQQKKQREQREKRQKQKKQNKDDDDQDEFEVLEQ